MSDIDLFGPVFNHGDVIFEQGSSGNSMFIVQSGAIEISCLRGEEKVVIALLEQVDFFGEMALVTGNTRTATAVATSNTHQQCTAEKELVRKSKIGLLYCQGTDCPASFQHHGP